LSNLTKSLVVPPGRMRTISRQDRSSVVDDNTAWSCGGVQLRSKMSLSQPVGKYLNSNMIGIRGANCSREPFIVIFWLRTHLRRTLRFLVGANVDHCIKIEYVPLPAPHNVFSCLIFQKKSGLGDVDPSFSDTLGKGRWNPLFIDLPCSKIGGNCRDIWLHNNTWFIPHLLKKPTRRVFERSSGDDG